MKTDQTILPSESRYMAATAGWAKHAEYICKRCLEPARINPHKPEILGCIRCGTTVNPQAYEKEFKK